MARSRAPPWLLLLFAQICWPLIHAKFIEKGLCNDEYFTYNVKTFRCDEKVEGGSEKAKKTYGLTDKNYTTQSEVSAAGFRTIELPVTPKLIELPATPKPIELPATPKPTSRKQKTSSKPSTETTRKLDRAPKQSATPKPPSQTTSTKQQAARLTQATQSKDSNAGDVLDAKQAAEELLYNFGDFHQKMQTSQTKTSPGTSSAEFSEFETTSSQSTLFAYDGTDVSNKYLIQMSTEEIASWSTGSGRKTGGRDVTVPDLSGENPTSVSPIRSPQSSIFSTTKSTIAATNSIKSSTTIQQRNALITTTGSTKSTPSQQKTSKSNNNNSTTITQQRSATNTKSVTKQTDNVTATTNTKVAIAQRRGELPSKARAAVTRQYNVETEVIKSAMTQHNTIDTKTSVTQKRSITINNSVTQQGNAPTSNIKIAVMQQGSTPTKVATTQQQSALVNGKTTAVVKQKSMSSVTNIAGSVTQQQRIASNMITPKAAISVDRNALTETQQNTVQREIEVFQDNCTECSDTTPPSSSKECITKPGAFINLCGACVGGKTGRPFDYGVNACGVCSSQDMLTCGGECNGDPNRSLDRCGRCLPRDDFTRDSCVSVSAVVPSLVDRCEDSVTSLTLTGAGLNSQSVAGAKCFIKRSDNSTMLPATRVSAREGFLAVELRVPSPGRYSVQCEDSSGAPLPLPQGPPLAVVDSGVMAVSAVSPAEIRIGTEVQLRATVRDVAANQMLLCSLWSQDTTTLVHVVPATVTSASLVTCGRIEPLTAGRLLLRVTASESAAFSSSKCAATSEVLVRADAPVLTATLLSPDLRALYFDFDNSVSGPPHCSMIFSSSSLALLGQGSRCRFAGTRLEVLLGAPHDVRPGTKVQILVGNSIRRAGVLNADMADPLPGLFTTVTLHPAASATPHYRVIPPSLACEGSIVESREIRVLAEDGRKLNISVQVSFTGSPPVDQRRNLLLWRSIRDLGLSIESTMQDGRFSVNNSKLLADVQYRLTISARDVLGSQGEEQTVFIRSAAEPGVQPSATLLVLGPETVRPDAELRAEALLLSCDPTLRSLQARVEYVWSIVTAGGPLPLEAPRGRVLRLPPFSVKGGVAHQVSCTAYLAADQSKPLATGTMVVQAMSLGLRAHVAVAGLTLGTGQSLELDASGSKDLDGLAGPLQLGVFKYADCYTKLPSCLQFSWTCERDGVPCAVPRDGPPTLLSAYYENLMSQSVLKLPPKVLAVGDHVFTVRVSRSGTGTNSIATTRVGVRVVRGQPPALHLSTRVSPLPLDPAAGLVVSARVENMRGRCWSRWRSLVRRPGDATVPLPSPAVASWEDEPAKDFPLTMTPAQLVAGARHRLQLETACSVLPARLAVQRSAIEVELTVANPPQPASLKVTPSSGQALRTLFYLRVESVGSAGVTSGPLLYEFGWREAGKTAVKVLFSTLYDLEFPAVFPCDGGVAECSLVPVVRVCDTQGICATSESEPIKVAMPVALTNSDVSEIAGRVDSLLGAHQFKAALALAQGALRTAHGLENADQRVSELRSHVEAALLATIEDVATRIQSSGPDLREALRILGEEGAEWSDAVPSPLVLQALANLKQRVVASIGGRASVGRSEPRRVLGNGPPPISRAGPRRKRRQLQSSTVTRLSMEEVEALLRISEHLILDSSQPAEVARAELERVRSDLHAYARGLCVALPSGPRGVEVRSKVASLAVAAVRSRKSELYLPGLKQEPQELSQDVAYLQVIDAGSAQCVAAMSVMPNNESKVKGQRLHKAIEVSLLGTDKSPSLSTILLRFPLAVSAPLPPDRVVKCAQWEDEHWATESCRTSLRLHDIQCSCRARGGQFSTILEAAPTAPPAVHYNTRDLTTAIVEGESGANVQYSSFVPAENTLSDIPSSEYTGVPASVVPNEEITNRVTSDSTNGVVMSNMAMTTARIEPEAEWITTPNKASHKPVYIPAPSLNPDSEWITQGNPSTRGRIWSKQPPRDAEWITSTPFLAFAVSNWLANDITTGRITTHVFSFRVADILVSSNRIEELEQRMKKHLAQQAYLPETAIPQVTYDKGTVNVRLEFHHEERLARGVLELTRLLRFGRLELRDLEGERIRVPAQIIPGIPGIPEFPRVPNRPDVPPPDEGVPAHTTGAPTSTKSVQRSTDMTTLPPAFPEVPRPSVFPPPSRPPIPTFRPFEPPSIPDDEYTYVEYDANLVEDPTLVKIVFTGAALMLLSLLLGAIRVLFLWRSAQTNWRRMLEQSQHSSPGKKQVLQITPQETARKYRQIQYPAEILAALAQFSHPAYSPSSNPVEGGDPHGFPCRSARIRADGNGFLVPSMPQPAAASPVKLSSRIQNSNHEDTRQQLHPPVTTIGDLRSGYEDARQQLHPPVAVIGDLKSGYKDARQQLHPAMAVMGDLRSGYEDARQQLHPAMAAVGDLRSGYVNIRKEQNQQHKPTQTMHLRPPPPTSALRSTARHKYVNHIDLAAAKSQINSNNHHGHGSATNHRPAADRQEQ